MDGIKSLTTSNIIVSLIQTAIHQMTFFTAERPWNTFNILSLDQNT